MYMKNYEITARPGIQELIISQTIDAPREIVFNTLCNPLKIPQWWGPERFTTKVMKMNVMAGGTWRFIQTDQEGKLYGFHGVYHDVIPPERLVYTSEFEGLPGHVTLYVVTLVENDGKTIITMKVIFMTVEDRDQMMQWGMEEG